MEDRDALLQLTSAALVGVITVGKYRVGMGEPHEHEQYADKAVQIAKATMRKLQKEGE